MRGRAWGSAPGKVILFGEHAVVYGRPAIAMPVMQVKAYALAEAAQSCTGVAINTEDLGRQYLISTVPPNDPLSLTCKNVLKKLGLTKEPDVRITLRSDIPIASGLGSGAATATAVAKALARWLGWELTPTQLSPIIYETEKIYHGTPSGIDNTVVTYEQPVWFIRGAPVNTFKVGSPLTILIANTGIASPTHQTVGDVRAGWMQEPQRYEALFTAIGEVVQAARQAIEEGEVAEIGRLMNQNHELLVQLGVSSEENDKLVHAAQVAGALGAKLSGGGRGGNNVILTTPHKAAAISEALKKAGAVGVLQSTLTP